jgi:bifunctional DNase/RNase
MKGEKMRCGHSPCGEESAFHIAQVSARRLDDESYFCEQHARSFLEKRLFEASVGGGIFARSEEATPFDVDLMTFTLTDIHQVWLREVRGRRVILLDLGYFEISALYNALKSDPSLRPVTHVTMGSIITSLGGTLQEVCLDKFDQAGGFFCAKLRIRQRSQRLLVDLRPSDALTLAVYDQVPILVSNDLLPPNGLLS